MGPQSGFKAKAAARGSALNCTVTPGCEIETDPALLRSILTNLVDNAVEYSVEGGPIDVQAEASSGGFTLRVANTVRDLEEHDLPQLFERFWRKSAARSPDGHTGLGLSLARVFARALGCELTATFIAPSRLAMTLTYTRNLRLSGADRLTQFPPLTAVPPSA